MKYHFYVSYVLKRGADVIFGATKIQLPRTDPTEDDIETIRKALMRKRRCKNLTVLALTRLS